MHRYLPPAGYAIFPICALLCRSNLKQRFATFYEVNEAKDSQPRSHVSVRLRYVSGYISAPTGENQRLQITVRAKSQSSPSLRARAPSQGPVEFYLCRASHVANAPSINPQTAQLFATVGIRTVADLLNANPTSVASELGMSHITPQLVAEWQLQAQLVCQIPDLRGYGAQLLVACGFTNPEQIANTRIADLICKVQDFCQSQQGQRILRGHEVPSAAKIKSWAQNAAQRRSLEAA
jgi:hypothetical protein